MFFGLERAHYSPHLQFHCAETPTLHISILVNKQYREISLVKNLTEARDAAELN